MIKKEYTYKSASGICDIKAWQFAPEGEVKAVIQMHHGMAEHTNRYRNFISAFTDRGYAIFINDMLGHGQSNDDKELLGYFGDKDGYKNILADAKTLTDIAKKEYPDKKFIIAGHSMGSLVMRCYINEYGRCCVYRYGRTYAYCKSRYSYYEGCCRTQGQKVSQQVSQQYFSRPLR